MPNSACGRRSMFLTIPLLLTSLFAQADTTSITAEQSVPESHTETVTTELSAFDKARAALWHLEEAEWHRYETLLQGIRGSVSPATLSPIEVLGIHARNSEDRRRYAERWALMMREDAERILAFQQAYDEAQQRLFPDSQLIDTIKLMQQRSSFDTNAGAELRATDRVLFFTETRCIACDAVFDRLLSKLPAIAGMDVYLLDVSEGDEARIRQWASDRQIDPAWVQSRRVTLNFDAGALQHISATEDYPVTHRPVVLRLRDEKLSPLPASRF